MLVEYSCRKTTIPPAVWQIIYLLQSSAGGLRLPEKFLDAQLGVITIMKLLSVVTAAALAAVSLSAAAAPAGMVSYSCDNGKQLNVLYEFNRQGKPVSAAVNAAGTQVNLTYNRRQSDSTGTTFSNRRGYSLSAGYIDKNTHTTSDVVGLTAPGGRFVVKNCSPVNAGN